jgi:hypothetical protein
VPFYWIKNHSAGSVATTPQPWDYRGVRPELRDKPAFREWCRRPSTEHYFYSAFEGANASARVNKENPPYRIHGLVADYDSDLPETVITESLARNAVPGLAPAWRSRTFSGGARLVWEFEEPAFCYNPIALKELLSRLRKEFKLGRLLPGLDENSFKPDQYWEVGTEWERVSNDVVPLTTLQLWIYQAGTKAWSREGTEIPLELVAAEVEKQYAGKWPGKFELGARGPRFWDPIADNDTASIVRETGMQCFTGDKPFVPWASIFGSSFTRAFEAGRISEATSGIFYDGRHYWNKDERGDWFYQTKDDLSLHLRVKCGLSIDRGRMPFSEVDSALYHIQRRNRVVGAVPFVLGPPGLHREPEGLYLNTSNIATLSPTEGHQPWGENFPWIAGLLDGYFSSPEQLDFFLAWLRRFYKTGHEQNLQRGQSIFIAGPVNQGKTLLSTRVIGGMVGGAIDVTRYMLGETAWNSSLFERALWTIDDSSPGKDQRSHTVYSAALKRHVANSAFAYEKKFKDSSKVVWSGRTVITLNDDQESLGMLPEWDISIQDKISLFRTANRKYDFTGDVEQMIREELPFFCRWLLDWAPPDQTVGDARFGVASYHEPSLNRAANERGRAHEFKELLLTFLDQYFTADAETKKWEGTATDLYGAMSLCDVTRDSVRKISAPLIGKGLAKLTSREPELVKQKLLKGRTIWSIDRRVAGGGVE